MALYSPLQMAADLPENYERQPAFQFIRDVPVDWERTTVLDGRIGDFLAVARQARGGPDWYIGAITDEEPRTIEVELSFLPPNAGMLMSPESFQISAWDIAIFVAFVATVVTVSLVQGRSKEGSEDYFLAGRGLSWWLIGFSLIASNISTEQFVGMSGNAASHVGLAIASYEWMAAITLVVVAFGFLPYFLRAGIFTMPEFLEYRYSGGARTIMAGATILIYLLLLGSVTYSGALTISTLAGKAGYTMSLFTGSLVIGVIAMAYVTAGGLKACAWADLIQGSALIVGGGVILWFAFHQLGTATEATAVVSAQTGAVTVHQLSPDAGAMERFWTLNKTRMNMFLPSSDTILPWTALMLGLWIPNFYYWGLNQYITQRTLGSASLAQGQRGIVFAAFMKLLIPFVIVIPGIIAFNLYSKDMRLEARNDTAGSLTRYYAANPTTQFVDTATAPTEDQIAAWQPGRYLLAIYPDAQAVSGLRTQNAYVLPITRAAFDGARRDQLTTFVTEDRSWAAVNPGLAGEIQGFNAEVRAAAAAAGTATITEKLIAYKYDTALAQLLGHVLPQRVGIVGFVLAALLGAVVSSLAAMLNAASTIFAMDVFKKFVAPNATQQTVVRVGRTSVVGFAAVAVFLAPQLGNPAISNSIFTIIQEGQGFISPGILAVFVFGLVFRRAPAICGTVGLLTNIAAYGLLKWSVPSLQFLNRMAVCFALCIAVMAVITVLKPLAEPVVFRQNTTIALTSSRSAKIGGVVVVALALVLYLLFSPLGLAG
jgi:SSS family solute:Na+ symporter